MSVALSFVQPTWSKIDEKGQAIDNFYYWNYLRNESKTTVGVVNLRDQSAFKAKSQLEIGDTFKVKMLLWPMDLAQAEKIKEKVNQDIFDYFYLVSVDSIEKNNNNDEMLEISMTLAKIRAYKELNVSLLELEGQWISVTLWPGLGKELGVLGPKAPQNKENFNPRDHYFRIFENPKKSVMVSNLIYFIILGTLVGSALLLRYFSQKLKFSYLSNNNLLYFRKIYLLAQIRHDFELLCHNKQYISKSKDPKLMSILLKIQDLQFKKSWSDQDLENIKKI